MAIKRPDIYEHNNPNEPFVDTDFVKGGFRTKVDDLTALYALAPKVNQLKEHATSVWVISESKYYTLVDASNVGNSGGWSDSVLGSGGDFIPLVGTAEGFPIVGNLIFQDLDDNPFNFIGKSPANDTFFYGYYNQDTGVQIGIEIGTVSTRWVRYDATDPTSEFVFELPNELGYNILASQNFVNGLEKSSTFTAQNNGRYRTTATLTITDTETENYFVQVQSGTCTIGGVDYVAGDWIWRVGANSFKINGGGGGLTNLAYTPSPTNGTITSDTGTDATIPLADGTNAGLFAPSEKTKLTNIAENANNYTHPNHSGDVTSVGDGVQTIANQAVTNAKFRDSTAHTVVGRAGAGNGSVADITLGNNTILGREGSGSVEGLSVTQVQSMIGFDSKQNNSIYITADTIAANNGRYIANGTLTVSDIVSPIAGSNYEVVVRGGSVTIDGVAFDAGSTIKRVHNGTSWQEYYFNPLPLVFTGASNLTTSRLWNNRIVKIVNTAPITVTLNDDIECSGNQESILDISFVSGNRVAAAANGTLILSSSVAGSLFMLSKSNASGTPTTRVYLNTL